MIPVLQITHISPSFLDDKPSTTMKVFGDSFTVDEAYTGNVIIVPIKEDLSMNNTKPTRAVESKLAAGGAGTVASADQESAYERIATPVKIPLHDRRCWQSQLSQSWCL